MLVRLTKTVLDVQGVPYFPGDEVDGEWRGGLMWVTTAHFLPLSSNEWEPVVPDHVPDDLASQEG
jgi:hypothetical protein